MEDGTMLLKVNGCELEIVEDKFVCFVIDDGDTSYFCEWKYLDPKLRERFKAMRLELSGVMQKFTLSDARAPFMALAEEYRKDSRICDNDD
jgi:hypothetical protein